MLYCSLQFPFICQLLLLHIVAVLLLLLLQRHICKAPRIGDSCCFYYFLCHYIYLFLFQLLFYLLARCAMRQVVKVRRSSNARHGNAECQQRHLGVIFILSGTTRNGHSNEFYDSSRILISANKTAIDLIYLLCARSTTCCVITCRRHLHCAHFFESFPFLFDFHLFFRQNK